MSNDQCPMSNECPMTKVQCPTTNDVFEAIQCAANSATPFGHWSLGIGHSLVIGLGHFLKFAISQYEHTSHPPSQLQGMCDDDQRHTLFAVQSD